MEGQRVIKTARRERLQLAAHARAPGHALTRTPPPPHPSPRAVQEKKPPTVKGKAALAATVGKTTDLTARKADLLAAATGDAPLSLTSPNAGAVVGAATKSSAKGGAFTIGSNGKLTYAPPAFFVGEDTFNYKVYDRDGLSVEATAVVTVTGERTSAPAARRAHGRPPPARALSCCLLARVPRSPRAPPAGAQPRLTARPPLPPPRRARRPLLCPQL